MIYLDISRIYLDIAMIYLDIAMIYLDIARSKDFWRLLLIL